MMLVTSVFCASEVVLVAEPLDEIVLKCLPVGGSCAGMRAYVGSAGSFDDSVSGVIRF